jgi:hypothetical protein
MQVLAAADPTPSSGGGTQSNSCQLNDVHRASLSQAVWQAAFPATTVEVNMIDFQLLQPIVPYAVNWLASPSTSSPTAVFRAHDVPATAISAITAATTATFQMPRAFTDGPTPWTNLDSSEQDVEGASSHCATVAKAGVVAAMFRLTDC